MSTQYFLRCDHCRRHLPFRTAEERNTYARAHASLATGRHDSFEMWVREDGLASDDGSTTPEGDTVSTVDRDAWIDLEERVKRVDNAILAMRDSYAALPNHRDRGKAYAYEHAASLLRIELNEWRREREDAEANPVDPDTQRNVELDIANNVRDLPNHPGSSQLINVTMRHRGEALYVNGDKFDTDAEAMSYIVRLLVAQRDELSERQRS